MGWLSQKEKSCDSKHKPHWQILVLGQRWFFWPCQIDRVSQLELGPHPLPMLPVTVLPWPILWRGLWWSAHVDGLSVLGLMGLLNPCPTHPMAHLPEEKGHFSDLYYLCLNKVYNRTKFETTLMEWRRGGTVLIGSLTWHRWQCLTWCIGNI